MRIGCLDFCFTAAISVATAFSAHAEFEMDRSAMSDRYWKIWNAAEEARIDADIEANRKSDAVFAVPALDGTKVDVEQIESEFRFGSNIFNFNQLGSKEKNARYKAMFGEGGIFNQATVPFYWREYEPMPGVVRCDGAYEDSEEYWNSMTREEAKKDFRWRRPATGPIVEFCRERGMTTYGHVLIYGSTAGFPRWVWYHCCPPEERFAFRDYGVPQGRIPDGNSWRFAWMEAFNILGDDGVAAKCPSFAVNLREAFRKRVEGVAERFGGIVDYWECTNESWGDWVASGRKCRTGRPIMFSNNYGIMPGDYQLDACLDAKRYMPAKAILNINDNRVCPEYRDMVKDLIASGAKIDVVGCQMHCFNTNAIARLAAGDVEGLNCAGVQPWTPKSIRDGLDLMAETGRPLHISEITIPAPGMDAKSRMVQAIVARNFYRACFAHKSTMGITWWNLVDGGGYAGEPEVSGLMTKDLERKSAYDALDELINHEWRTKTQVVAKDGTVSFRGFRGKYRLSWKCAECGIVHFRYVTLSDDSREKAHSSAVNPFCRPRARSFRVDGKLVVLDDDEMTFNIVKLYPDAVKKGRDGKKWATVEFDIVVPKDGEYPLEIHNDYYGKLSVNGGEEVDVEGPWLGFGRRDVTLRKGSNHITFRTRSGSGGNWTVGFRASRDCGVLFK